MPSLQGQLLIASPKLGDPNFYRAVVLMIRHNEDGALGLVLDRPSNTLLSEVWESVSEAACATDSLIYHGGPCPGPLMAVHTDSLLADEEAMTDLYFATGKEHLERLVGKTAGESRFYVGYAGWGGGQLEAELDAGGWFCTPAKPEQAFWPKDDLWEVVCREVASTTRIAGIKVKNPPPDPSLN